ncbi:carboxylate-amine ligase [Leifsonia poae]|uniref:Putative glutamate--cysteine ligase 2 n=1 Tax=Leifsonia poae TaxID=110933 RepID=A0A9W6M014_9MICO|nr:YbdK family carboxylate-amine ligase [Leifsonia poae]GLJ76858.1 putative glutamate--cysteine ligase 2-3 [Leifsonia poae]
MQTTFGIEEEFMLLDPVTLVPVEAARAVMAALGADGARGGAGSSATGESHGSPTGEFFASQIEHPSPVFTRLEEARAALGAFRDDLASAAGGLGLLAASTGAPFSMRDDAALSPEHRYRAIAEQFRAIVPDHQINGLHVHVGVPSREAAVVAMNRLRPWLPALLALSANSPFWRGRDTGFDSWRAIHSRRWTTYGIPPRFRDAADYDARTAALRGVGGTTDAGTLNWVARPSERFPTVEVRVFDAQTDVESSIALAALTRGLVASPEDPPVVEAELLDASLWHAARDGIRGQLLDPTSGTMQPAPVVIDALVRAASTGLDAHGDEETVRTFVTAVFADGNGAERQRGAYAAGGVSGLALHSRAGAARGGVAAGLG